MFTVKTNSTGFFSTRYSEVQMINMFQSIELPYINNTYMPCELYALEHCVTFKLGASLATAVVLLYSKAYGQLCS